MLPEEKKKDLGVQNSTLILGGRGWGRQGKGISISTMQKGAILQNCVNTLVPHCLNAKLCYCTQVERCMTLILTEIKGINDIIMF